MNFRLGQSFYGKQHIKKSNILKQWGGGHVLENKVNLMKTFKFYSMIKIASFRREKKIKETKIKQIRLKKEDYKKKKNQ